MDIHALKKVITRNFEKQSLFLAIHVKFLPVPAPHCEVAKVSFIGCKVPIDVDTTDRPTIYLSYLPKLTVSHSDQLREDSYTVAKAFKPRLAEILLANGFSNHAAHSLMIPPVQDQTATLAAIYLSNKRFHIEMAHGSWYNSSTLRAAQDYARINP